jgi:hypothetical protein
MMAEPGRTRQSAAATAPRQVPDNRSQHDTLAHKSLKTNEFFIPPSELSPHNPLKYNNILLRMGSFAFFPGRRASYRPTSPAHRNPTMSNPMSGGLAWR